MKYKHIIDIYKLYVTDCYWNVLLCNIIQSFV